MAATTTTSSSAIANNALIAHSTSRIGDLSALNTPTLTAPAAAATITTTSSAASVSTSSRSHLSLEDNDNTFIQCPSCDKKLQRFEVATHCEQEMQRLKEISEKSSSAAAAGAVKDAENVNENDREEGQSSSSTSAGNSNQTSENRKRKPWSVFQKVQRNRQSRMKQRTRKRPSVPEHPCPVCNLNFPQDEIQEHAEACLRRSNRIANGRGDSDDHSSNEGDEGEEYEEYEWAGQKRIRVSSLLQGGYAAIGIGQPLRNGSSSSSTGNNRLNGHANDEEDEDDEDLNVDEDDTQIYGPAQYGESDVIPSHIMNEDESDITSYMRRLITAGSSSSSSSGNNCARGTNTTTTDSSLHLSSRIANNIETVPEEETTPAIATTPAHYQQIIDSLKAKLQHYEQQHIPGKYKCLICLDDYRNPAISVACWHVHCEQCWLRSLGARKLCPQCNLITTPKDLRRIYM